MKRLLLGLAALAGLILPALGVVPQTLMGNANYSATTTDTRIVTSAAFTAARTLTLPSAGGTNVLAIDFFDIANAITNTNTLTIAPQSGETINGSTSSLVLSGKGDRVLLIPVTGTNWFASVFPNNFFTEAGGAGQAFSAFNNYLDNSALYIQQRGTGAATCGTTSGVAITSYSADRWGCDVNVTSGAGQLSIVTSGPTPPAGFTASLKFVKNSGSLTQPQCAWQEIPTVKATQLAGQTVTLSSYLQALAAMDNGNVANLVIITGTGTDQGLGVLKSAVGMTASPAITPVWTGLATLQNQAFTITTSWARYTAPAIAVPSTVTEMAVGVCWTPAATAGGATDGLAFVGAQLEPNIIASPFEFKPLEIELSVAQKYYWQQAEVSGVEFGNGACQATNTPKISYWLPASMIGTPTVTWTVGGFNLNLAGAAATAATGGTGTGLANSNLVSLAFTNTCTAGGTAGLVGTNTTGSITVSADF